MRNVQTCLGALVVVAALVSTAPGVAEQGRQGRLDPTMELVNLKLEASHHAVNIYGP